MSTLARGGVRAAVDLTAAIVAVRGGRRPRARGTGGRRDLDVALDLELDR